MSLTVKQLIKALSKFPPDAKVGLGAFDHSDSEINGFANSVIELEDDGDNEFGDNAYRDHGAIPVIRG